MLAQIGPGVGEIDLDFGAMKTNLRLTGGSDSGETAGITLAIGADKS